MRRFCHSKRLFLATLSVILLLPQVISPPTGNWPLELGRSRILSGDEPHYLVVIHSLLLDRDLDLKNNYASVHEGSGQAGEAYAGSALDHHTVWFIDDERIGWPDIFETDADKWQQDASGRPRPTLREGISVDLSDLPEYGTHPPGMAFLLAPLLFPFKDTAYVESLALLCSGIALVIAMFFFRMLLQGFTSDSCLINLTTAIAFLGTPLWHYGRTLFTEPYLTLFALAAYALVLRKDKPLLAGCLIAAGMLMKPPFLLLLLPLAASFLVQKRLKAVLVLGLPAIIAAGLILLLNTSMFGSPFRSPQTYLMGNLGEGILGLSLSQDHGVLPFVPIALVALAAWPKFLREHLRQALVIAAGFILYFLLMALWADWQGGWCYGPRLVVPVIPFLLIALISIVNHPIYQKIWIKAIIFSIGLLSILTNALGAILYWKFWARHPFMALLAKLGLI